jgi:hypothetical protein
VHLSGDVLFFISADFFGLHRTKKKKKKKLYELQLEQIFQVLDCFVLPTMCLHSKLEIAASDPFLRGALANPEPAACLTSCSFCRGEYSKLFPKVRRSGLRKVIFDIYLDPDKRVDSTLTIDDSLITSIRQYKDDAGVDSMFLILGSVAQGSMKPIDVKKVILILLAAKIIGVNPTIDKDATGFASVILGTKLMKHPNNDALLMIDDDESWKVGKLLHLNNDNLN